MGNASRNLASAYYPYGPLRRTEPFRDAEEAWMWTMAALMARREGARYTANQGKVHRPCEPDDVVKCLDNLYRQRRIDLVHARVMRIWGERQIAPNQPFRANVATGGCGVRQWTGWNGSPGQRDRRLTVRNFIDH
jgi:hypothetical protein